MQEFDGYYRVTYYADPPDANAASPPAFFAQAHGAVVNGRIAALDVGGCRWSGSCAISGDVLVADVTITAYDAGGGVRIYDVNGVPTRGPVSYQVLFNVSKIGTTLKLDASVSHGPLSFEVVFERVRLLDG